MMLKTQTQQVSASRSSSARARVSVPLRTRTVVRAEETTTSAPPALDLSPNTQAATGYVEFDTAGQSNMYPVVTKAYEAGSDQDTADTGAANTVVGAGAAVIAVAVLALGLGALSQLGGGSEPVEQFKSLSEYAAAFSAQL